MGNHHYEKWIYKTPLGLLLIAGGIFYMYYSISHLLRDNWILHGIVASVAVAFGAYLLSSAAINKVKADMIKKQKQRQMS
jgi:uncharacterized membrane protein HdeD (DUF308 family)